MQTSCKTCMNDMMHYCMEGAENHPVGTNCHDYQPYSQYMSEDYQVESKKEEVLVPISKVIYFKEE